MDKNPYRPPMHAEERPHRRKKPVRRRKTLLTYLIAATVGGILGGALLIGPLADLDDAGGLQALIGAFLGVVIYRFLF